MGKLAVSAVDAEPRWTVLAATDAVVFLRSTPAALDISDENGAATPFGDTRAG